MPFIHHGAADFGVKGSENTVDIYSDVSTYETVRGQIEFVEQTNFSLIRLGLRADVDLVVHVPYDTTVERGNKIVWNSNNYEVYKIEQESTKAVKRLLLKHLEQSGINLGTAT